MIILRPWLATSSFRGQSGEYSGRRMQPILHLRLSKRDVPLEMECPSKVTVVTSCTPCAHGARLSMLKFSRRMKAEMLALINCEDSRQRCWCAALVLFAICTLTVSVATRYTVTPGLGGSACSLRKHSSPEPSRQRLMKGAATWVPPVACSAVFAAPSSYPRLAPAAPLIPALFFEKSLYNRPPPDSNLLS